ncbi:YcgN family cysteine cluster protein [Pontivivens ytuae]|uniref:YcgN family cysteine cluster protein n=1 Tax=Pontivivens ytuae TaxID=2789856 RepID=A0A7S9LUY5_9RHOB|nr:YcgN family cysteine cluster protein [Pontivivens ytuae]QPH55801.1 YcgN family cysteine cluster protein [Pontivivens ytuae]
MTLRPDFWTLPLDRLTKPEWEALCDGCGKCCLLKLEDEETGEIEWTSISCRLFDPSTCRCGNYAMRKMLVPGCVVLTPETLPEIAHWMPETCAYRRLSEGRTLPDWHPLLTGRAESVAEAGHSMGGRVTPEYEVDEDDWFDHVTEAP